jgi:hypothetical protein
MVVLMQKLSSTKLSGTILNSAQRWPRRGEGQDARSNPARRTKKSSEKYKVKSGKLFLYTFRLNF